MEVSAAWGTLRMWPAYLANPQESLSRLNLWSLSLTSQQPHLTLTHNSHSSPISSVTF